MSQASRTRRRENLAAWSEHRALAARMNDAPDDTQMIDQQLAAGRPRFGALDELRSRVLAGIASRGPRKVGRYLLGRAIGSGAFGTVYEADDPELRRKVAIKLFTASAPHEVQRVLREARMLATVSSPNVVSVFEVGALSGPLGAPYLVMELVEGPTMRAWLATERRPWREVVELGLAAARGLWAAHQRGVVHRDFKPDNVILATDGRPRVVDFGLARAVDQYEAAPTLVPGEEDPTLTPAGSVLGTPAYMAPEAFVSPCTPRSDQYSLCVTLFEGLFGTRPFAARTTEELMRRVAHEEPSVPRGRNGVPSAIVAAVMQGLRRDPSARHSDVGELVAALERGRSRGLGGPATWVGGAVLVGALGLVAFESRTPSCTSDTSVWSRLSLDDAALGASAAAYQKRWQDTERELCDANGGKPIAEPRRHCLDRRLEEVAAVAEVLATLDTPARAQLSDPFGALPAPERCSSETPRADQAHVPFDRAAVARIESSLAHVRARTITRQPSEGLALSTDLLAAARGLGHPPLLIEVAYAHARLLLLAGLYREAATAFEENFHTAEVAGLDAEAADAASELLRLYGYFIDDPRAARLWAEHAEASFARAGTDPKRHGVFAEGKASVAERAGDLAGAAVLLEEAIAAATADGEQHDGMTGGLYNHLGVVLLQLGRTTEAIDAFETALAIFEAQQGIGSRASALSNLGAALMALQRNDEALVRVREALEIRERVLDDDHLDLAASRGNMADVLERLGRVDEAARYIDPALASFVRRVGDEHPYVAIGLEIRGRIRGHGDAAARREALADYRRAAQIFASSGPAHAEEVGELQATIAALAAEVEQ